MTREDAASIFGRSRDADWDMFCRGRRQEDAPWAEASEAEAGEPEAGPVPLGPDDGPVTPPNAGPRPAVRHLRSRVVGIAYPNEDGSSRREAVRACKRGDLLLLAHRPDNPVDPNAVAVLRADRHQLGYLPAFLAKELVAEARQGTRYIALVARVTGQDDMNLAGESLGVHLVILALEGGATKAMARQYLLGRLSQAPSRRGE